MIPGSVDIDTFFVTLYFIILFYHHPISQLQVYNIHPICCLFRNFPWCCVWSVCQGRYGRRNCRQKRRIGSLLPAFGWRLCTVLFRVSSCWFINDDIYYYCLESLLILRSNPEWRKVYQRKYTPIMLRRILLRRFWMLKTITRSKSKPRKTKPQQL